MRRVFIGSLLIFLDFKLTFGTVTLGLLPDFIGYILLAGGLAELSAQSGRFGKVRPIAIGMAVYTAVLYALDLIGVSVSFGYLSAGLGLISTILSLLISYSIVQGVMELERALARNLQSGPLFTAWKAAAVTNLLTYPLFFLPVLNLAATVAAFLAGVVFLVFLNRTKKAYERWE